MRLIFRYQGLIFRAQELIFRAEELIFRAQELIFRAEELIFHAQEAPRRPPGVQAHSLVASWPRVLVASLFWGAGGRRA